MDDGYGGVRPQMSKAVQVSNPVRAATAAPAARRGQRISKFRVSPISYWRALFESKTSEEPLFVEKIQSRLGRHLDVIPLGRARAGIHLLVKYAIRNGRKKVLFSPFTIPDVANMIVLAGGEPVFFDAKPNSTICDVDALLPLIDESTGCVIVTHYHVNEAGTKKIAERCKQVGALLFDDCAISFGSNLEGKPIGSLTDASIFSLSAFKVVNFFWGGFITTSNREMSAWLQKAVSEWPRLKLGTYGQQARKCLKYDLGTRPAIFHTIVFPMLLNRVKRRKASLEWMRRIESETIDATLASRPHVSAFAEWNRKIGSIDHMLQKRREIARIYHRVLSQYMISGPVSTEQFNEGSWSFYPVMTRPGTRDEIRREMMLAGFDTGLNYYPNVHQHEKFANAAGKSDNFEHMVANSLHLPTHFGVTAEYAEAMASKLAELMARA